MNFQGDNLCCCEYFDVEQQRNHILACCCNCQYLDASCDSFIRGKRIPSNVTDGLMLTLQDRLRIPWYGGARKVAADVTIPVVLVPSMLILATINVWWTVTSFTFAFVLLLYLYSYESVHKSRFFLVWTISSLASIFSIFELVVIPFLKILLHENIILSSILSTCVGCVLILKARTTKLQYLCGEIGNQVKSQNYCSLCHAAIPDRDYHCSWINTCVGNHNRILSMFTALLTAVFLLYDANLTLTTVCHPFIFYKTILLPDDCSEVYEQFEYALCFVSAVYCMCIVAVLTIVLIFQILSVVLQFLRINQVCTKISHLIPLKCRYYMKKYHHSSTHQGTIEQY